MIADTKTTVLKLQPRSADAEVQSRCDRSAPEPSLLEQWRADFHAHGRRWGAQGFWAMSVYRFGRWRYGIRSPLLRKPMSAVYKLLFKLIQIVTGIELPCEARVGRNFIIDHFGGIVVSGDAVFGDNCRIRQGVSVGLARVDDPRAPVIGNDVDIGSGAKVLGGIVIGDNVSIGANAVVVRDVPSHCIAVGVPAVARPKLRPSVASQQARTVGHGPSLA